MENLKELLANTVIEIFHNNFQTTVSSNQLTFNETPKNFTGDLTLVVFPLLKYTKLNPEASANAIGTELEKLDFVESYNVVKGFLNLVISEDYWKKYFSNAFENKDFGRPAPKTNKVLIEYSSPNTNKPLHLGHVRNNVLGFAVAGVLKAAGYQVNTCNLVNDRGIHICKSMLAWQKAGGKDTPENTGLKGDKLVGHYYVEFEKLLQAQTAPLMQAALDKDWSQFTNTNTAPIQTTVERYYEAPENKKEELLDAVKTLVRNATPIMQEARQMLQDWEASEESVISLWKKMNGWVYDGFAVTYKTLGVQFDKTYYESDTYLLGKDIVKEGLEKEVFFKKEDGSVWVDLTDEGLDQKLLLRSDGTSVYITQDLGTADLRYNDFKMDRTIYVVGNEQEYHFQVLQKILKKLEKPYADGVYHFSYGMVDLPSGKMKSREGTVVDADDLISDMIATAKESTEALGKTDDFSKEEALSLFETMGLGALKFFLLRVDPKKRILFNPEESIDLHGYTGPFVQYTYARTQSILRRYSKEFSTLETPTIEQLEPIEKELILKMSQYSSSLELAALELNPAKLIDYVYELAKLYNRFYSEVSIFNDGDAITQKRVALSVMTGRIIKDGFNIVGINVPDRM
ncbi:MAG TPA: arginine--tRNA ligase [Chitinophagales bacterium]|nr:arginine--tRNA ligase [Chitinophagales bacterium]